MAREHLVEFVRTRLQLKTIRYVPSGLGSYTDEWTHAKERLATSPEDIADMIVAELEKPE